jgi:hypothetical protein
VHRLPARFAGRLGGAAGLRGAGGRQGGGRSGAGPIYPPTFVEDRLQLRPWFQVNDLDDLNNHLVGSVIAVLTPYLAVKVKH